MRNYNAPENVSALPKILIMTAGYWGKGDTITEAWDNVKRETGKTLPALKKAAHLIYSCFDYVVDEGKETEEFQTVKARINSHGAICYHCDYPPRIIHQQ